jgi:hypothetical protein
MSTHFKIILAAGLPPVDMTVEQVHALINSKTWALESPGQTYRSVDVPAPLLAIVLAGLDKGVNWTVSFSSTATESTIPIPTIQQTRPVLPAFSPLTHRPMVGGQLSKPSFGNKKPVFKPKQETGMDFITVHYTKPRTKQGTRDSDPWDIEFSVSLSVKELSSSDVHYSILSKAHREIFAEYLEHDLYQIGLWPLATSTTGHSCTRRVRPSFLLSFNLRIYWT